MYLFCLQRFVKFCLSVCCPLQYEDNPTGCFNWWSKRHSLLVSNGRSVSPYWIKKWNSWKSIYFGAQSFILLLAHLSRSDKVSFCDRPLSVVCPQCLHLLWDVYQTYSVARYQWELGSYRKPARSVYAWRDSGPLKLAKFTLWTS